MSKNQKYIEVGHIKIHGPTFSDKKCSIFEDLAELFNINGAKDVEPGTVVVIDPQHVGELRISQNPYDKKVVGVVSGANGINPGIIMTQTGSIADGQYPVGSLRLRC